MCSRLRQSSALNTFMIMQNTQSPPQNSNFIKAMIKIANPDWTPEQIEAEAQKKMREMANDNGDGSCEFCSS